jgi:hypothetical protein
MYVVVVSVLFSITTTAVICSADPYTHYGLGLHVSRLGYGENPNEISSLHESLKLPTAAGPRRRRERPSAYPMARVVVGVEPRQRPRGPRRSGGPRRRRERPTAGFTPPCTGPQRRMASGAVRLTDVTVYADGHPLGIHFHVARDDALGRALPFLYADGLPLGTAAPTPTSSPSAYRAPCGLRRLYAHGQAVGIGLPFGPRFCLCRRQGPRHRGSKFFFVSLVW